MAIPSEDDGLDFSVWWCGILPGSPPWTRNILHERDAPYWHETDMPKYLGDVRYWENSGKHMLALSFSGFDPKRTFPGFYSLSQITPRLLRT
jgi:hypothetical protein